MAQNQCLFGCTLSENFITFLVMLIYKLNVEVFSLIPPRCSNIFTTGVMEASGFRKTIVVPICSLISSTERNRVAPFRSYGSETYLGWFSSTVHVHEREVLKPYVIFDVICAMGTRTEPLQ